MTNKQSSHPSMGTPFSVGTGETLCAWCLREQGKHPGNGSHGICERHRVLVWKEYQDKKARRVNNQ